MKNPYAAGFYALLIAICVISVCFFWGIWTSGKSGSTQEAFAFVNSVSALIQALAAGIVAALAYRGLTTWKQELIFGKCLSAVWDTSRTFRMIEKRINQLRTSWEYAKPKSHSHVMESLEADPITKYLEEFAEHCVVLDKVVVRKQLKWSSKSIELKSVVVKLALEYQKPTSEARGNILSALGTRTESSLQEVIDHLDRCLLQINDGLEKLELTYSL
ncbi:hypothetical protein [Pseudomonas plecoglossicida]|uniref:hypothetical protein n=1 Tax=Pseudomonas plecoglossicida TaxID=70775 RepID=UPI003D2259BC